MRVSSRSNDIDDIKEQVTAVLRRHDVAHAGTFGSFARGTALKESDLDVLVEFSGEKSLLDLASLKLDLEDTLARPVDVVTYRALDPAMRKRVLRKQVINL